MNVVVGLGMTGFSCVRHLVSQEKAVCVMDTREHPPKLEECQRAFPDVPCHVGGLETTWLSKADEVIISPGVSDKVLELENLRDRGISIVSDVELFARVVNKPVIAVTGTNGKSTVVSLLGEMSRRAGLSACVAGNIGVPVLDAFAQGNTELYILELSSFQLEHTHSLKLQAGTLLNVTLDHLDRYPDVNDYIAAKQRIYRHCQTAVINRADPNTRPRVSVDKTISFGLDAPEEKQWGIRCVSGATYLSQGKETWLATNEMRLVGRQNWENALVALALGSVVGLSKQAMLDTLREFSGLPHRCQWILEHNGVAWYNDSKGTNVGATLAAIEGLESVIRGQIILIAGGQAKGQTFESLIPAVGRAVKAVILMGEAREVLQKTFTNHCEIHCVSNMSEAVKQAKQYANAGDAVLLSPACASFDMFQHFQERGDVFTREVLML